MTSPTVKLNSGQQMPLVGFGWALTLHDNIEIN